MRWADLTALIATVLWLGANLAIAFVPAVMFPEANIIGDGPAGVLLLRGQLGEMFGQVLLHFMICSAVFAALLLIARVWGWTIRLRRRAFHRSSLVGVVLLVGILICFACAWSTVVEVDELRVAAEIAKENEASDTEAIRQRFEVAHKQSMNVFVALTVLLAVAAALLAVSLARRDHPLPASAPPAAP